MILIFLLVSSLLTAASEAIKNPRDMNKSELVQAAIASVKAIAAAENEIYDKALQAVLVPEPTQKVQDAINCMPTVLCKLIAEYWLPVLDPLPMLDHVCRQAVTATTRATFYDLFYSHDQLADEVGSRFFSIDGNPFELSRRKRDTDLRFSAYGFNSSTEKNRYCTRCYEDVDTYAQPAFIDPAVWHKDSCERRHVLLYNTIPCDPAQLRNHIASCLYFFCLKDSIFRTRKKYILDRNGRMPALEDLEAQCVTNS